VEGNIGSNPAAAQVVFSSGIPIVMAPLDVTSMLKLDAAGRSRIFSLNTPITNALAALYHLWPHETPTLFDPMAVALVLDAGLCHTKCLAVEVDSTGSTRAVDGKPVNATVELSTDAAKFSISTSAGWLGSRLRVVVIAMRIDSPHHSEPAEL